MRAQAAAAAVIAATAVAWWVTSTRELGPPAHRIAVDRSAAGVAGAARREAIAAALPATGAALPARPQRPPSLDGTEPDGTLATDADGRLLVSPELRRRFDYWFAASGEEPDDQLAARIAAEIRAQLDDPAEAQALALLDRFVAYRAHARALAQQGMDDADLDARVTAVRDLRRELFGPDADALFGDETALVDLALAERRIADDPSLSPAQRTARLEALHAGAPEPLRAARAAALAPQQLAADETRLRFQGATDDDIRQLREEQVGAAAANRLDALDSQRAAWRERVDAYRAERSAIDGDATLDPTARDTAIASLRDRRFAGPERLRIEALDQIELE
jgi:lipase chaperone LimK